MSPEQFQILKSTIHRLLAKDQPKEAIDALFAALEQISDRAWVKEAIQAATKTAIDVPFKVMQLAMESFPLIKQMVETGNPNSITDAGVGALCARVAVYGAYLNVKINTGGLDDKVFVDKVLVESKEMLDLANKLEGEIISNVIEQI